MFIPVLLFISSLSTLLLLVRSHGKVRRYEFNGVPAVGDDLPTVSVCIAARNETHALSQCLERVLKSNYQKLEVLVLDDSSTDDTSLIIKSFASAGVRFIPGTVLPDGWLGKNHAYQTLISEASGDIILFMDVDTTIRSGTISRLVDVMLRPQRKMISVLPLRSDIEHPSAVFNTMRYHWELLLGTKKNPPAVSALWMVKKSALSLDGVALSNYSMSVRPEQHLARRLNQINGYRYFISSKVLGVGFEKRLSSQWQTAIRLYYPMIGSTIWKWLAASTFVLLLIAPLFVIVSWQWDAQALNWSLWLLFFNIVGISVISHKLHGPGVWRLRVPMLPFLLLQEYILICISLFRYLTNSVTWKGRSVSAQPNSHERIRIDE